MIHAKQTGASEVAQQVHERLPRVAESIRPLS